MAKQTTVVTIGAGISGLSAGKLLHEAGVDVIVLEARDRVGGRTLTIQNDHVGYVDLGGSYFGPTQDSVLRLVEEFGLTLYRVYDEQDYGRFSENKLQRFQGIFPESENPAVKQDLDNYLRTMEQYGATIPLDAPWDAPNADIWDKMTVKDLHDKIIWTKEVRSFANFYMTMFTAAEPYECSALWYLWQITQSGGIQRTFSVTGGAQERKLVGGSQQISIRIAALLGDRVRLNEPVSRVEQSEDGVTVYTSAGVYKCDYVILALPPAMQAKLQYEPPLPAPRNQLIQRYAMGSVIKVIVYYKRPFWRQKGMSGTMIIEEEGTSVYTLDDTKPDGSKPALVGFIAATRARRLCHVSQEERRSMVTQWIAKAFQTDEGLQPVHYEEKNWNAEQWSGGGYGGIVPPGFITTFGRELRKPLGRYHFAGTECATKWSGYIDGAVQAGERAAREILNRLGKLEKEKINMEPPKSKVTLESEI